MGRINMAEIEPEGYQRMLNFEQYLSQSGLKPQHKELIKLRASQMNGCAFCINMHARDARKMGETEQRIYLLSAWRESGDLYTEEEKLILALTEEVTYIRQGLSDSTYHAAVALFGEPYLAKLIMAATIINMWNRISIATRRLPE